jgi:cytoskeleton protein RodZ
MTHVEKSNNIAQKQPGVLKGEVNDNVQEELSEDMEVMGPGQILSDARKKIGLTQQEVADKLNFRKTLVNQIESEEFDTSLPETFNRGYLRNYAKLVNVSQEDVMASYDQINVAKTQASELQSFSKGTEKLAESNRIMWISYFILAILIGSTVVWWMQNTTEQDQALKDVTEITNSKANDIEKPLSDVLVNKTVNTVSTVEIENITEEPISPPFTQLNQESTDIETSVTQLDETQVSEKKPAKSDSASVTETAKPEAILTKVTFTFSGDCWVNISDATGERIAWGVKKLGYVMNISGQAPFNVTLGKPELVAISFADEIIDMSQFNQGNIAKFTLPVTN